MLFFNQQDVIFVRACLFPFEEKVIDIVKVALFLHLSTKVLFVTGIFKFSFLHMRILRTIILQHRLDAASYVFYIKG